MRCACRHPRARAWPAARRPCSSACVMPCASSSSRPGPRHSACSGEGCRMNVEHILASKGHEVKTIKPDASVEDALRRLCAERIGSLVVSENGTDLVGIVSDRDILNAIADHGTDVLGESVGSVMTEKVFTCSRHDRVSAIMALMTTR